MNSTVRQQENPSNNLIKQVEGRGASNVDMPIISFNNCHAPKYTLVVFDMFRVFCKHNLTAL